MISKFSMNEDDFELTDKDGNPVDLEKRRKEKEQSEEEDEEAANAAGYNPYRDKSGKFAPGPRGRAAVMSKQQALESIKDSVYKQPVYHGTTYENGQGIAKEGFSTEKSKRSLFGEGVYLTPAVGDARSYAMGDARYDKARPQQIVSAHVDIRKPYIDKHGSSDSLAERINQKLIKDGVWDSPPANGNMTDKQFDAWHNTYKGMAKEILKTHDAIIIPTTGPEGGQPMVVLKDPKKIKIYDVDDANKVWQSSWE